VPHAANLPEGESLLAEHTPGFAVVDLKLKGEASGLACVQRLHVADADMLIAVLNGPTSIATTLDAVKLLGPATTWPRRPMQTTSKPPSA
jgi:two-component system response regulator RegA